MFSVKTNIKSFRTEFMPMIRQQVPYATSQAINAALPKTRKQLMGVMDRYIEGGATNWTKYGLVYVKATKRSPRAVMFFKSDRFYMKEVIYGGVKHARGSRLPEPVNAPLNARGNYRTNWLQQAMRLAGISSGTQWSRRKDHKTMTGAQGYEVGESKRGTYGLWRWQGRGKNRKPRLMVLLDREARQQRKVFPANQLAEEMFMRHFNYEFPMQLMRAIKSRK